MATQEVVVTLVRLVHPRTVPPLAKRTFQEEKMQDPAVPADHLIAKFGRSGTWLTLVILGLVAAVVVVLVVLPVVLPVVLVAACTKIHPCIAVPLVVLSAAS